MPQTESEIPLKLHEVSVLYGKQVAVDGRLGGMNRKDFGDLVDSKGGSLVELSSPEIDLVVVGAESLKPTVNANSSDAEHIAETELWESLGYIEPEMEIGRLYTPAMLAEILNVPIASIRRWHRRGLIQPVRQVKKLPYFDFQEVASALKMTIFVQSHSFQ
jgi:hypothetical protein